jgi:hypothetical protein
MHNLLSGPVGVMATRHLARSALPDAPVVAAERRPPRRRVRRGGARALRRLAHRLVAA